MKVLIESPYAGDVERNLDYLGDCIIHSLGLDEAPFASHGFYTKYLDDLDPIQRAQGMNCGFEWGLEADVVAFYVDHGMSGGMIAGLERAAKTGQPIVVRRIL